MSSVAETVFRLLFKYRPVVFERGELAFGAPWPAWVLVVAGIVALALAAVPYALTRGDLRRMDRVVLASLRLGAFALLAFCLSRPMLVVATVVPQQNFLGVLLDDSRSMQIADDGRTRGAVLAELFGSEAAVVRALGEKFKLRFFRFSEMVERVNGPEELEFTGRRTDLGNALDGARRALSGVPLAGLVVVTDGAENAGGALDETVLRLQADGVPLHLVGLGKERFAKELEVTRVEAPRDVLAGSSVAVDVTLTHTGMSGERVTVSVEDAGRIVGTSEVELPREGETATARVHFTVEEPGARTFRVVVPKRPDELIGENNSREMLMVVNDRRERILYFEGEPRFEVKFLRRALDGDEQVHVVTLLRTAENKYLRLDVEDSTEVAGGFPKTRQELFAYRGLILGSIEASFFTHDQLRMIADFVSQRGGGLLVLGGRQAYAEGGYGETPLADVLPVVLDGRADSSRFYADVQVELTPFGRSHPITQLGTTPAASEERWRTLPALSTVNPITRVKPGASTLLRGREDVGDPFVVLAYQRYGRGRAVAFPVQDSWLWQMHADIPLEDQSHERFWQQLLRWLVSEVRDHVTVVTSTDRAERGQAVTVTAQVVDSGYVERNGAEVVATIVDPTGAARDVPMEWIVERDGEYVVSFTPTRDGRHEIHVTARERGVTAGTATAYLDVADLNSEFYGAHMRRGALERLAEATGGRFYTPPTLGTLPEDVSFTESGATVREERSLWDMPIVFLLLVGLIGAEWALRRKRGLA